MDLRSKLIETLSVQRVQLGLLKTYSETLRARGNPKLAQIVEGEHRSLYGLVYDAPLPAEEYDASDLVPVPDLTAPVMFVSGYSGAGKSFAIKRSIREFPQFFPGYRVTGSDCPVKTIDVPSGCTFKGLGLHILSAHFDMSLPQSQSETVVWEKCIRALRASGTHILHFDEFAHVGRIKTDAELRKVRDKIKELPDRMDYPFGLILSGLPEIDRIIEGDGQAFRRVIASIEIPEMSDDELSELPPLINELAKLAGVAIDIAFEEDEFLHRHRHVCRGMFGRNVDLIRYAIEAAKLSPDRTLRVASFAAAVHTAVGWPDELNPYVCNRWETVDTLKLFDHGRPADPFAQVAI
ncbi:UNVERIFIED_ORG: hypothetical protein M2438_000414 [Methylobacterium sp. SuP10 SLI 274]|uniref:ATP-binding protein n=1 Tax=Methylorubrum extorquens TaxID=408 RepID=UPI00209FB055|nr:ATP-binding protein [Methylorubrum extorquens]MDF9861612.1 hypothetical protein [Methylorubrum pseudosasae]MDH6635239.1 hypothetical protein [Methylobacterium sp. SuP10 SLI 274]MDH6664408.1 hypothetical protein [Methylorubrum zatmanii]MCP1561410.1 hypothetical protein [Methylorubrum extorquens]MDF9789905.1 hypothetical protein [Methylorubrum extorquens]